MIISAMEGPGWHNFQEFRCGVVKLKFRINLLSVRSHFWDVLSAKILKYLVYCGGEVVASLLGAGMEGGTSGNLAGVRL